MLQSFLMGDGLDANDIEMLCILGAAFMPSIVGLLLAFFALWLPDDGYVLSWQFDDRQREPPWRFSDAGRRKRVEGFVIPASENPHRCGTR